jgi:hypothetical protein
MGNQVFKYSIEATHSFRTNGIASTADAISHTAATETPSYITGYFFPFVYPHWIASANSLSIKIELEYYHHLAETNTADQLDFTFDIISPSYNAGLITTTYYTNIKNGTAVATANISGNEKTYRVDTLGISGQTACTLFNSNFKTQPGCMVGIRIHDTSVYRSCELSGLGIASGDATPWSAPDTAVGEVLFSPRLIITITDNESNNLEFDLRYTTADSGSSQLTPANSLGGYISTNSVYTSTQLTTYLSPSDTTANVETLPTDTSGLAQIGPEIIRYTGTSSTDGLYSLTGLTRAIAPDESFASSTSPHAEYVKYLPIASLFGIAPKGSSQYRCVGIMNTGSPVTELEIHLLQSSTAKTILDASIEQPDGSYSCQIIASENSAPSDNARFGGFFSQDGDHLVGSLGTSDIVFLWLKRTLQDTGAVIMLKYKD